MLAAVIPAALESIGDYYAAARLAGAPKPPGEVVSRALAVEAACCAIAGVWGTTSGSTAYAGAHLLLLTGSHVPAVAAEAHGRFGYPHGIIGWRCSACCPLVPVQKTWEPSASRA